MFCESVLPCEEKTKLSNKHTTPSTLKTQTVCSGSNSCWTKPEQHSEIHGKIHTHSDANIWNLFNPVTSLSWVPEDWMWFSLSFFVLFWGSLLLMSIMGVCECVCVCEWVCGQGECLKTTEGLALSALIFRRSVVVCIVLKSTGVQFWLSLTSDFLKTAVYILLSCSVYPSQLFCCLCCGK